MQQKNIKTYSEFLRMATFFLMNKQISTKASIWDKNRKIMTKNKILHDPKHTVKLEVMAELKELFERGGKLLKKIE